MIIESDEITMGNPNFIHGFSYCIFSSATAISVNQTENIIQHAYWGENISIPK